MVGNPNSAQYQAAQAALGLIEIDPDPIVGSADTIGGGVTYWGVAGQQGQRIDVRYRHAIRLHEGSRARLLIDVPVSYVHADAENYGTVRLPGRSALVATLSVGLELPVTPEWTLTPRLAYGLVLADGNFGGDGELLTASLSSNYAIAQLGTGSFSIGNMVGYSTTVGNFLVDRPGRGRTENWLFRNGLAYQFPLGGRLFGRAGSVRASYVFTVATQDALAYDRVHEADVSVGVRTRESNQRGDFELLRLGLVYTHAAHDFLKNRDYDSLTVTLGYRF